jgi:2'-5' RNA ligase
MPHITLLYPFRPRAEWDALLAPLSRACAQTEPFTVTLQRFDRFRHGRSATVWLAPEPAADLVALQAALWHVVPDCDDTRRYSDGFTPHLSVGQVESREADDCLAKLREEWETVSFEAAEVQLIWREDPPEDAFCVGERIALGRRDRR